MKYRILGRTGLKVSELGFGAWAIGGSWGIQRDEDSIAALHRALDLGVNFIDTAAGYGEGRSEKLIGKVLKEINGRHSYKIMLTETNPDLNKFQKTVVPNGHCFVLGDNRRNALDSRYFGSVPLADIKGRVDYVYYPAESWSRFGRYRD